MPLEPSSVKVELAATRYRPEDGTIATAIPGPRPSQDTIVLTASSDLPRVRALRLEVFPDDEVSMVELARSTHGGGRLVEISLEVGPADDSRPREETDSELVAHHLTGRHSGLALDRNLQTYLKFVRYSYRHAAVFLLEPPVEGPANLRVTLKSAWGDGQRYRLLITADEPSEDESDLPAHIVEILRVSPTRRVQSETDRLSRFYRAVDTETRGTMETFYRHMWKHAPFGPLE